MACKEQQNTWPLPVATTGVLLGVEVAFTPGLKLNAGADELPAPPNVNGFVCEPEDAGATKLNEVVPAPNEGLASDWLAPDEAGANPAPNAGLASDWLGADDPAPNNFKPPDWLADCPVSEAGWPLKECTPFVSRTKIC